MQGEDEPIWISINKACHRYGIGRTFLHSLLKAQNIRAVKAGSRTLIDVRSGDDFFASLPAIGRRGKT